MNYDDDAKGASKSLRATIAELEGYLNNQDTDSNSPLRQEMNKKIAEVSKYWAKWGFRQGQIACHDALKKGENPFRDLKWDFGELWLAPGVEKDVRVKSTVPKNLRKN